MFYLELCAKVVDNLAELSIMPLPTEHRAMRAANYWRARRIAAFLKVYSQDNQYYQAVYNALREHAQ
jgi:hypothetical protein